jgi:hypothetical protein
VTQKVQFKDLDMLAVSDVCEREMDYLSQTQIRYFISLFVKLTCSVVYVLFL